MRKLSDKVKKLDKGSPFNFHRCMQAVKYDTMFVIIDIRRVLEAPGTVIYCDGDDPVVFSGWMVQAACIALIFTAQLAFWIAAGF